MRTTTTKKTETGEEVKAVTRVAVPSKMTAAVLYGSEDLRIEKIDVPALAADEVLLRVRLALTDGTDLKVWKRGYHAKMIQPPAVFGHELVGEIVAVGKRVDPRWRIGMRVVAANSAPCLRCYHCRRGQENLCDDLLFNNGAYADYMRIPGRIVVENMLEVPHSVDDQSAALAEPLACVLRGGVVNFFSGLPSGARVEIDPAAIHYSEIKLISPFHHTPRFFREALEAIRRGDISARDFVTEEIRLADLPQAFARMKSRSGETKLAVRP